MLLNALTQRSKPSIEITYTPGKKTCCNAHRCCCSSKPAVETAESNDWLQQWGTWAHLLARPSGGPHDTGNVNRLRENKATFDKYYHDRMLRLLGYSPVKDESSGSNRFIIDTEVAKIIDIKLKWGAVPNEEGKTYIEFDENKLWAHLEPKLRSHPCIMNCTVTMSFIYNTLKKKGVNVTFDPTNNRVTLALIR